MAVAPVLERKINAERENAYYDAPSSGMSEEERHNSKISSNYAKLINPEYTLGDIIDKSAEKVQAKPEIEFAPRVNVQKPYLVENARADADIFRADSIINKRTEAKPSASAAADEEENEDLRPTQTTIQYRTIGAKKGEEVGKIENTGASKRIFSKKNKIIIAAIISIIAALFVLIIVNSAIISSVSKDISMLQTSLASTKVEYSTVNGELQNYVENLADAVNGYAQSNGMVLR